MSRKEAAAKDTPAGVERRHDIRLTRLRNIRRLALARGEEATAELLDLLIEEELGA